LHSEHPRRIERVADLGAASLRAHESGLAEDAQVLGHSRLANAEHVGEVARTGLRMLCETKGDAQAHRMTERLQPCRVEVCASCHLDIISRSIVECLYRREAIYD
jgi:hypothetical protein